MTGVKLESVLDSDNIVAKFENDVFGVPFLTNEFFDEKTEVSFIKKVEQMVRGSQEYRAFIRYVREELQFNHCSFLNTLDSGDVTIELHHHPFTLFDIVSTELNRHIMQKKTFNTFSISFFVMSLHYQNMIGLVPLSKTFHEMVHSGNSAVKIPKELVVGNFSKYYEENKDFMAEATINRYVNWLIEIDDITEHDTKNFNIGELFDETIRVKQLNTTSVYGFNENATLTNVSPKAIEGDG